MLLKIEKILTKYEIPLIFSLVLVFILVNIQGLDWGLPEYWNPDEIMVRVNLALDGEARINGSNFDYPGFPMYFMFFWGKLLRALGHGDFAFAMVNRSFSVFFGGMTVLAAFASMKQISTKKWAAFLAALLVATSNELTANIHFAHNDPYVTFFSALVIFLSLKYISTQEKKWLYLAFFTAGITTSCKFNGGGIIISTLLAYLLVHYKGLLSQKMAFVKTCGIGGFLSILGFGIGTPQLLTSFLSYMNGVLPALWRHANANKSELSTRGILTQWDMLIQVFGLIFFILGILAILTILAMLVRRKITNENISLFQANKLILILFSLFILDLPILVSYNVQSRFFLPLLMPFSICIALLFEIIIAYLQQSKHENIVLPVFCLSFLLVIYAGLRVTSTMLIILNDARFDAAAYISTLPYKSYVEKTLYSPNIAVDQFVSIRDYPLTILKFDNQELPEDLQDKVNTGEPGIELRRPDYFIVSSLIKDKFIDYGTCRRHEEECEFFNDLFAGETNYQLIQTFEFNIPWYLPSVNNVFFNPDIYIFERVEK